MLLVIMREFMERKSSDKFLIGALRILSHNIKTDDGVVNMCLLESADRMEELSELVAKYKQAENAKNQ
jgi:PHP family Zn ribbon phosphoesterase